MASSKHVVSRTRRGWPTDEITADRTGRWPSESDETPTAVQNPFTRSSKTPEVPEVPTNEWEHSEPTPSDPHTPVEQRFLLRLRDNPDDLAMRMVYADWLEERGQPRKANFLRLLAEPELEGNDLRLRYAARDLPSEWRAIVSRAPIERCHVEFSFKCPKSWEALASTDDAKVRHCGACARNVYFCTSLDQVRTRGRAGDCVAFCATLVRETALDEYDGDEVFMGEIATSEF